MTYKPLQTHGLTKIVKTWIPPSPKRFWQHTPNDRDWMMTLCRWGAKGYGQIDSVEVLEPLYDVRDERMELLGYSIMNPCDQFQRMPYLPFDIVRESRDLITRHPKEPEAAWHIEQAKVDIRKIQIPEDSNRYLCWVCNLQLAADLIASGWVKVLGPNRLDEYVHEARFKAVERRFRNGGAFV